MPTLSRRAERGDPATAQRRLALLADTIADRQQPDADAAPARDGGAAALSPADEAAEVAEGGGGRHRAPALSAGRRAGATVGDLLPAPAQRLRAERGVSGQHVAVVALVLAALIAAGAWWVLAGRPGPPRTVAPEVVTSTGAPAGAVPADDVAVNEPTTSADPATGAGEQGTVVVDVAGKVRSPGLVTLPAGSRVADALKSAGGVRDGVDLTTLNLARPLVDGEQILVGVQPADWPGAPPVPTVPGATVPGATPTGTVVDLNTATLEQLDTLPGIGPVTGQAILDWRTDNGSFTSVDELLEVDGIGDATLADLRDLVTV